MTEPQLTLFTQPWAEAFGDALNASASYRQAAATWEGSLVFVLDGARDSEGGAVYVDLWRGRCRAARAAGGKDVNGADFVIRADRKTWRRLLANNLDVLFALMSGRLEIARGSLSRLLPFATAARELVMCAAGVGGRFPGDPA